MTVKQFRDKIKFTKDGNLWVSGFPVTDWCFDSKRKHTCLMSEFSQTKILSKKEVLKSLYHIWSGSTISMYDLDSNTSFEVKEIFTEDNDWKIHYA